VLISFRAFFRALVAVFALGACAPDLPQHVVDSVVPVWAYNGEVTPIGIRGEAFFPVLAVDGGLDNGGRIDAQFQVKLVGADSTFSLNGVSLVDYEKIEALVPQGLEPGLFDVLVVAPNGLESKLEQAFTITDTRADRLEIQIDGVVHPVNGSVAVNLSLRDPDGLVVEQDLEIELVLDSVNDASGVIIQDWGLEEGVLLDDAVGVRGRLGLDGQSVVVLTSTLPDELELTLRAADSQSIVREDNADLVFEAGEMDRVEILLPTESYTATAGESFDIELRVVDVFGNLVEDESARVLLFEECGGFLDEVTVVGSLIQPIFVRQATGSECPRNRIQAVSGLPGLSNSFSVLAGPLTQFHGTQATGANHFIAGEPTVFQVTGQDDFLNPVDLDGASLTFVDSMGSLASANCTLSSPGSYRACELVFEASVESTVLSVTALDVAADVGDFEILPNSPSQLFVGAIGTTLVAGTLFELEVSIADAWGNPVNVNGNQTPFTVSDGGFGSLECNWLGSQVHGVHVLSCSETTASEHMQFTVEIAALGLQGISDIVTVVNGALSTVSLNASNQNLVAGESFDLEIEAFDAFGNPYSVQSNANLILSDSASGLSVNQAQLGSSGTVIVNNLALEKVGDPVVLNVAQGGLALGSLSFQVTHANVDHLTIEPDRGWAWVGTPRNVSVLAVDVYENPVLSFQENVQISSLSNSFLSFTMGSFQAGQASSLVTWDSASLGDQISASSNSVNGVSDPVDAVLSDCASPPIAEILFTASGKDELVMCLTGTSVNLGLDFSGSTAGAEALSFYHLFDGQNRNERGTFTTGSLNVKEVGVWVPELMVVDAGACGSLVDAVLWTGENDGSVTGPVTITASHSSLVSGSSTQGTSTLTVSAEDCAGDVASGESLVARVNLGELDPAGTVFTDTGFGRAMILNNTGGGNFDLSVAGSSFPGEAVVAVGNINGSAYGEVAISVSGDDAQPTVAWVDPSGSTAEQLNRVEIQFSETMESSTLSANNVALEDANGSPIGFSLSLEEGNTRLVLQLDSLLDASTESVVLSLTADIRDSAGNFLDGDLSGSLAGTDFVSFFGNVQDDGLVLQACTLQDTEFVPDGDPSVVAGQSDEAEITLTSSVRGDMWLLEVFGPNGDRVRTHRESTASVSTSLFWDGRGDAGLLLDPEAYLLSASVEDAQGNVAAACQASVLLNQSYNMPERQE
jgi:hypothetical protein